MKLFRHLSLLAAMAVACAGLSYAGVAPTQQSVEARIKVPQFPNRDFAITVYGAKPGTDRCKTILIEGVKIIRSPMWEINPSPTAPATTPPATK